MYIITDSTLQVDYTTLYIKVLLPLALQQEYTYRVPQELNEEVAVGKRVVVQFGKKKIYTGLIADIEETPPTAYQAKYILSILDDIPLITDTQLNFWKWISKYYMCTLGEVMQAALPPSLKLESQSKVILHPDNTADDNTLDALELPIIHQLRMHNALTLDAIDKLTKRKSSHKYIQSLYDKGLILIEEDIKETYKPKMVSFIGLQNVYMEADALKELFETLESKAALQLHVVMKLLQIDRDYQGLDKNEFIKSHNLSPSSVKTLITKHILWEEKRIVERIVYTGSSDEESNVLTPEQELAYDETKQAFVDDRTVLLHGITSSGKTHLYIKLIEEAIHDGGQVLYLLPEISLTTQLIRRIQTYFGDKVLVHHSRFNHNERQEIWDKVKGDHSTILLAPRSGVFMPFHNLNLVIVDEEHENTYKQSEPNPRYHARDAAIVLAGMHNAKVILGSATPSLESRHNAEIKKYALVELSGRYSGVQLPDFEVVDMQLERKQKKNNGIFSSILLNKIKSVVDDGGQTILFQNRKGYVPITECEDCSWTPRCIHCDITLTYYRTDNKNRCHFCGYSTAPVQLCPACKGTSLKMMGYGTERIEQELQNIFPKMRIQRLDYESTRTKASFENIIHSFEKKEVDVLIGTQMIAKGLDFEHLRLVGIVDADHALNFPDFRAFERSFQLFTQVAGRAGRREDVGEVVIQTNQPQHRIIEDVVQHNYLHFYREEMMDRKRFLYPPFTRLIRVTLKHKDKTLLSIAADQLGTMLKIRLEASVLGPQEPHVSRIRNLYLQQMMIKIVPPTSITGVKEYIHLCVNRLKSNKKFGQVRAILDVDPN